MTTPQQMEVFGNIAKESAGFAAAEIISMAASLGIVAVADKVALDAMKATSKVIGKTCIEPFLDTIETSLSTVCRLKECQPDKNKSREERAERLAHTMLIFGAAWAGSMAAKLYTRGTINRLTGVNPHEIPSTGNWFKDQLGAITAEIKDPNTRRIFIADEAVHYGSLLLMNTTAAPATDKLIDATSNILQKQGMSKDKAKEVAGMAMIWEMPNFLGMLSGIGAIAHNHMTGKSHVAKFLESRTALSNMPNLKHP